MFVDRDDDPNARCQVSLSLSRDEESGEWFVDKVEFSLGDVRNVTSFPGPTPLESAFTPDFTEALRGHLPSSTVSHIHADARAVIETPRLVLGGIRVIAHQTMHGIQLVTVRFRRALGAMQTMLLSRHRSESSTIGTLERSAADALLNLLRPCLDLAAVDPELVQGERVHRQVAERLEMLAEKKDDLAFFVYLLKRYVENVPDMDDAVSVLADGRARGGGHAMLRHKA